MTTPDPSENPIESRLSPETRKALRPASTAAPARWRRLLGPAAAVAALGTITLVVTVLANGNLGVAVTPVLLALLVWAAWKLPLRVSALTLVFLALAVEGPGDMFAYGVWTTPWHILGDVMWSHLNLLLPVKALVFSGIDFVLVFLAAVVLFRQVTRSPIDSRGSVEVPSPLTLFAVLSLVAIFCIALYGLARGGSFRFSLWQVKNLVYLPLVFLLYQTALRGPRDHLTIGKILLVAALFKAVLAIGLRRLHPSLTEMPFATTHHDSMLFATALCMVLALVLEKTDRKNVAIALIVLPLLLYAMMCNNRRLVWTQVGIVPLFFFMVAPWSRLKRTIVRSIVLGLLPLLLYGAAGWNSDSRIFKPVRTVRSMLDSRSDHSSEWRDQENFNLIYTFWQSPVFGSGFGHPYIDRVKLDDVTQYYELEPYVPHNNILGLWAFGGLIGFAAFWAFFAVGMFFAMRGYRFARDPVDRAAALTIAGALLIYLLQAYGDMGFGTWIGIFLVAPGLVLAGKLAVATGAWPARVRAGNPVPASAPIRGRPQVHVLPGATAP